VRVEEIPLPPVATALPGRKPRELCKRLNCLSKGGLEPADLTESRFRRLRMNRLAKPATSKLDLELFCLAVSVINGCESCLRAHEKVVLEGGLGEDQVHDAVRIAAVVHAAALALEIPGEAAVA